MGTERWVKDDPEKLYALVLRLDQGASGDVWLARNKKNQEPVAIKIIRLVDSDPELRAELDTEIESLDRCVDNDFIIGYHGAYQKENDIWIVLEYAEIGSLQDLVTYCMRPLNEGEIKAIMASLFLGLAYLHELGIVHRDIKAKNILVTSEGRVKLADFGVAGFLRSKSDKRKTAVGSPHFMAPEVIEERPYDGRADVWAAGIAALELAELEPPHADKNLHWLLLNIPIIDPPSLQEPDLWSQEFKSFVKACVTMDISKRNSAAEMLKHPFLADQVAKQQADDFHALKMIVAESVQHFMDAEQLEAATNASKKSVETVQSAKRTSIVGRVSASIRKSLNRVSFGQASAQPTPKASEASTGTPSKSSTSGTAGSSKPVRKSKRLHLRNQQASLLRVDKSSTTYLPAKAKARPTASGSTTSDAYVQALVGGNGMDGDERAPGGERALSAQEIEERDKRADEIKRRLYALYDKYK